MSQPPATPPQPTAPAAPTGVELPGGATLQLPGAPSVPMTRSDVAALRSRRSELSNQLNSANGRREELVKELAKTTDPAVRAGLEERLKVLDARLAQLEADIAANGRMLAAAPSNLLQGSESAPPPQVFGVFSSGQATAISIVFTLAVLMPLALASARRMLRKPVTVKPTAEQVETAQRLARMEQAVDAIAVEIERISEGQRFVTQLMAQRQPALAVGQAQAEAPGAR